MPLLDIESIRCPITSQLPVKPVLLGTTTFELDALRQYYNALKRKGEIFKHPINSILYSYGVMDSFLASPNFTTNYTDYVWQFVYDNHINGDTDQKTSFLSELNTIISVETLGTLTPTRYNTYLEACLEQGCFTNWTDLYLRHLYTQDSPSATTNVLDALYKTNAPLLKASPPIHNPAFVLITTINPKNDAALKWIENHHDPQIQCLKPTCILEAFNTRVSLQELRELEPITYEAYLLACLHQNSFSHWNLDHVELMRNKAPLLTERVLNALYENYNTNITLEAIRELDNSQYTMYLEACLHQDSFYQWNIDHTEHHCTRPWSNTIERVLNRLSKEISLNHPLHDNNDKHIGFFAVKHHNIDILQWMISNDWLLPTTGWNIAHTAAKLGHIRVLQCIKDNHKHFEDGHSFLRAHTPHSQNIALIAAQEGHTHILEWIFKQSELALIVLLTHTDDKGNNIAHYATKYGHLGMLEWICNQRDLELQAILKAPNAQGHDIADIAAMEGNIEILKWLDSDATNITLNDTQYNSYLEACLQQNSFDHWDAYDLTNQLCTLPWSETIERVLNTIYQTKIKDNDDCWIAITAAETGNINVLQWILDKPEVEAKDLLLRTDEYGHNIAQIAAYKNKTSIDTLQWIKDNIQEAHALITASSSEGYNIVHIILTGYWAYALPLQESIKVLEWIENNFPEEALALFTAFNAKGHNSVHIAAKSGHLEILKWMALHPELKKLLSIPNRQGLTPCELARQHNQKECVDFLESLQKEQLQERKIHSLFDSKVPSGGPSNKRPRSPSAC